MDRITLRVTLASTVIALLAAGAAFWSGYEAHKGRVDDERPLLRAEAINSDNGRPLRPFIDIHIFAMFKTPAKNIRLTCMTAIDAPPDSARWNPSWGITNTVPIIFPEIWVKAICPVQDNFNPTPGSRVVQFGFIRYQDTANTEYLTPFCFNYFVIPSDAPANRVADISICDDFRGLPDLKH